MDTRIIDRELLAGPERGAGAGSATADATAGRSPTGAPSSAPSRTVLVVEDDPVISHLIDHLLKRRGFTVQVATDGRQADELLDTLSPPAVVILDVMLPFVDGFTLVERLRGTKGWANVPIIMLTSKSQESYVVRAFGAGVNDYVIKPFRPEELVARVRRLAGG